MKILGQRWLYRVGNARVAVDNAFSWTGWTQERLVVNDETVQQSGQWFGFKRAFDEPWLTSIGEDELRVRLRSKLSGINCEAEVAGELIEPNALFETSWSGDKWDWPGEHDWVETKAFSLGIK